MRDEGGERAGRNSWVQATVATPALPAFRTDNRNVNFHSNVNRRPTNDKLQRRPALDPLPIKNRAGCEGGPVAALSQGGRLGQGGRFAQGEKTAETTWVMELSAVFVTDRPPTLVLPSTVSPSSPSRLQKSSRRPALRRRDRGPAPGQGRRWGPRRRSRPRRSAPHRTGSTTAAASAPR